MFALKWKKKPSLDPRFETRAGPGGVSVLGIRGEDVPPPPPEIAVPDASTPAASSGGRVKDRTIHTHGNRIESKGHIGGSFRREPSPDFTARRLAMFERLYAKYQDHCRSLPHEPIKIVLPDGREMEGVSMETTPLDIAGMISKGLAKKSCVARVRYTRRVIEGEAIAEADKEDDEVDGCELDHLLSSEEAAARKQTGELWDLGRALEGDCHLELLTFDDEVGRSTFWHSSAHVLGEALERDFGVKLTMGPPLVDGFYYDCFMGKDSMKEVDMANVGKTAEKICKEKQEFQRLVMTKEEAMEMFAENPFKQQVIAAKIPDGGKTTAYRCGTLVDLCTGPHLPSTDRIGAFETMRATSSNWLGDLKNDSLQRVYAVSFPSKKELTRHKKMIAAAKERDHRTLGSKHELFFFHDLSPGSCFWLPHGARVFRRLTEYIQSIYWRRGFHEVVTPNVYNLDLWRISGHAEHYLNDMFTFDVEGSTFGLKPMNCPAHCLMFRHRIRNYRELPLRLADFGALHRNEASGALTGLTRVRRFQQDDAHCFVRPDQIRDEVRNALRFVEEVYGTLGFTYALELSTRPKKAMGDPELWRRAEVMMKEALEEFGREWKINPGDGAFYGPKIDIKVYDALGRPHQCATVQVDFQLPLRFNLEYVAAEGEEIFGDELPLKHVREPKEGAIPPPTVGGKLRKGCNRPVMIHRAVLGSVERMMAVLTEHLGGKWPFWLSPRQIMVIPVGQDFVEYAKKVQGIFHDAGFYADVELSNRSLPKMVREAQTSQYNVIMVVGAVEQESNTINVRIRDVARPIGSFEIDSFINDLLRIQRERKDIDAIIPKVAEEPPTA